MDYNNGSILNPEFYEESVPDTTAVVVDVLDRSIWQKPSLVMKKMGDVTDKVIADIGVGTGYFFFKIAPKAKKCIAIDIDTVIIAYVDSVRNELPPEIGKKIETRIAKPDNPNLYPDEVDIILIINTVAYLPNLPNYFECLRPSLKDNGFITIIDYKMKKLPISAPPREERIYLDQLETILTNSGYEIVDSDDTSLDYQYILTVRKAE